MKPEQCVKQECLQDMDESDVSCDVFSLKVESKNEISVEDQCISLEAGSVGALTSSADENILDSEPHFPDEVSSRSYVFSTGMAAYHNKEALLIEHVDVGDCTRHKEISSQQLCHEPVYISVKQEPPPDTLPNHGVKQEILQDLEVHDVDCNRSALKVECEDDITVEDHSISLGERSDEFLTQSSFEDISYHGCITGKAEDCNRATYIMEDHASEVDSKRNQEISLQQPVDVPASNTFMNMHEEIMTNAMVSTTAIGEVIKELSKYKRCGKHDCGNHKNICHLNIQPSEKSHKCGECGKYFDRSGNLTQHLKIHSGEKDHKCVECGISFTQSGNLRRHLRVHNGKQNFICAECGKCFSDNGNLRRHLKLHTGEKNYECAECGKCFTQRGSLRLHLKIHSGEKDYKCPLCRNCFIDASTFRRHLRFHAGEKNYRCAECGKCFAHHISLKWHVKVHSFEEDHKCVECEKSFSDSDSLRNHIQIHFREKEHVCSQCGKCFTQGRSLRRHLKIHSGEKNYECPECGTWFRASGNLRRHLIVHSGEKNHKCADCGKCFNDASNLRKHLKIHKTPSP